MKEIFDTIIIGGGPAGAAAGVYAARKKMKTLLLTDSFGGQSIVSDKIGNWIGEINIGGFDLAQKLEEHVKAQEGIDIKMPEKAVAVKKDKGSFEVTTDKDNSYLARTLLVTSGGRHRKLGVPGEKKFDGKGVAYCSTCDAPLYRDKTVAIVGGGNSGLEAVIDLEPYAKKIYLVLRREGPSGDPTTYEQVKKIKKAEIIKNAETTEILGDNFVSGMKYKDKKTGRVKKLNVGGVFVEIGSIPNSEFLKGVVEMNKYGELKINHQTNSTSVPGIFAAGDVTDELYKQNNIAVGEAIKATLSAYNYVLQIKKKSKAADRGQ